MVAGGNGVSFCPREELVRRDHRLPDLAGLCAGHLHLFREFGRMGQEKPQIEGARFIEEVPGCFQVPLLADLVPQDPAPVSWSAVPVPSDPCSSSVSVALTRALTPLARRTACKVPAVSHRCTVLTEMPHSSAASFGEDERLFFAPQGYQE